MSNKKFSNMLAELQKGLSIREFAKLCEIPESSMRNYLSGKRILPMDVAVSLAEKLNTTTSYLATGKRNPIGEIDSSVLRKIYEADPEVIEIEEEAGRIIPVVRTYDDEKKQLHFFCIHCNRFHSHGRGGEKQPFSLGRGGYAGDRSSHCFTKNSPFRISGYILDVVGKISESRHRNKKPKVCPNCNEYYSAAFNACECGFDEKPSLAAYPQISALYKENGHLISKSNRNLSGNALLEEPIEQHQPHKTTTIQNTEEGDINIEELTRKTREILLSNTTYRSALAANIRAFHEAVEMEADVKEMKKDMKILLEYMQTLTKALEAAGIAVPKRDAAN